MPETWYWQLRKTLVDFSFHLLIKQISSVASDCENGQSVPTKYLCKASPIMRLEDGTTRTDWELTHRVFKVRNTSLIEEISSITNNSVANCRRLVDHLTELYKNTLSRRLNELEWKVSGDSQYKHSNLVPGICFEFCKLQQVWPNFMIKNSIM